MSTPNVQRDPIESRNRGPSLMRLPNIGWFNAAMLAMGTTAAIGFLVALGGAYLAAIPNPGAILAGTIIVLLAAIAWIVAGLFVIISIAVGWFTSCGKTTSESRTNREPQ
ncbi:MAG: hypothetical protein F4X64_04550 [Chloroflexi bacterium]|nr:hypothetical protein [Chloroflexota bacterium]